jgi:hypothetical protein
MKEQTAKQIAARKPNFELYRLESAIKTLIEFIPSEKHTILGLNVLAKLEIDKKWKEDG